MARAEKSLIGLDRLRALLDGFGVERALLPPSLAAPAEGDPVLGVPFDPQLATLYRLTNGGKLGDLILYSFSPDSNWDLVGSNTFTREVRRGNPFWTDEVIYFATESGEPYRFAVVPALANPEGVQPVVYLFEVDGVRLYPLASSVDKLFDLWARFCEPRLEKYGRLDSWMVGIDDFSFILNEPRLVAQDEALVLMIQAGRFDRLMEQHPNSLKWASSVLREAGL